VPRVRRASPRNIATMSTTSDTAAMLRRARLDPAKYGWTACGGIGSILEPHEMARRSESRAQFLKNQKRIAAAAKAAARGPAQDPPAADGAAASYLPPSMDAYYTVSDPPERKKAEKKDGGTRGPDETPLEDLFRDPTEEQQQLIESIRSLRKSAADGLRDDLRRITVRRTTDDGRADVYTYHRGRVGMEPRDPKTGELLADVDPSDTNDGWEPAGSTVTRVSVQFPVEDLDEDDEGGDGCDSDLDEEERRALDEREKRATLLRNAKLGRYGKQGPRRYTCSVLWDVGSPDQPSPEEYAFRIGAEYGLDFSATMELRDSIEQQLDEFMAGRPRFYAPLAPRDSYGLDRPGSHFGPPESYSGTVAGAPRVALRRPGSSSAGAGRKSSGGTSRKSDGQSRPKPAGQIRRDKKLTPIVPPDQVPKANPRDDPYCAEVLRRCVKISKGHARELVERGDEALGLVLNENCHICRSRKETVLMFPCGRHGYCENHCRTRLSCAATDYNPEERTKLPVDHCPVCSLTCTCAKCERKLDEVGGAMKVLCKKQGCGPGDVVMERVFEMAGGRRPDDKFVRPKSSAGASTRVTKRKRPGDAAGGGGAEDSGASRSTRSAPPDDKAAEAGSGPPPKKKQKKEKKRKKKPSNEPRRSVLRVPVRELPRECHLNQDYDPSTPADFAKVFCPGRAPVERAGPPPAPDGPEKFQKLIPLPVDGHFHKCCVCDDDLTADDCHYCSVSCRGFHARCLEGGDDATVEGWECTRSRVGDRTVSDEEDIATGANDDAVRESFGRYADLPAFASAVSVLGDVKSILDRLVRYEYGWVFAHPVDVSVITDYGALVSRPMDYATVAGMIDRGAYDPARYNFSSLDDLEKIVLQALVDVEQVFQNCFVYNTRGCQFYRAGEVQERKWTAYYDRHIGDRLTEGVRSALAHFRGACRAERAEKAQIRVVRVSKTSNTAVAVTVVDPTTMSLVKQYLSKASAIQALQHLSKAGYECEVDVAESGAAKFRLDAADGSGTTLFGYLWIRTNKLHSGKFVVAKAKE